VELARRLGRGGWPLTAAARSALDITDPEQIAAAFAAGRFDLVVNAAAYTAVDRAEAEEAEAFRVNVQGTEHLARACAAHGAALFHVSTDYVFDGRKSAPYAETDAPAPLNAYGRSKLAGEEAVARVLDRRLIIRTAWLFGATGANFVRSVLRLAAERETIAMVADQRGNPTAAADLAWCVGELAARFAQGPGGFPFGVLHCVNRDEAGWHDFARAIIDHAAPVLGRRPVIREIATSDYPAPARRPANSRLDCTKLQRTFGIVMPSWRRTLPHVVDEILSARPQPGEMQ
jgi:dTDP-4-dehydrorhamnose reductase